MAKSKTKTGSRRKTRKGAKKSTRKPARKASGAKAGRAPARSGKPRGRQSPSGTKQVRRKTHLSPRELREFREMLVEKRRTLVGDLSGMEAETTRDAGSGNLSSMPTHMADVGTDNFEHEFTLGLLESEQALLREIDEAIARIDEKTYGVCLGTGKHIPKARLRAKPWAKYTVDYTRLLERGLVRPPGEQEGPGEEQE